MDMVWSNYSDFDYVSTGDRVLEVQTQKQTIKALVELLLTHTKTSYDNLMKTTSVAKHALKNKYYDYN